MKVQIYALALLALTTVSVAQNLCPEQNGEVTVHIANDKNCNTFFTCTHGEPVLTECPAGLEFNAALTVCDWPQNAGCQFSNVPESSSQPSTTAAPSSTTAASTTSASSSTVTASTTWAPSSTTEGQSEVSCPEQNGKDVVLLPNDENCSTFFTCTHGEPVLTDCPAGLEFNAASRVCDWPENAGCQSSNVPDSSAEPSTTAAPSSTTAASTTSASSSTVTASTTWAPSSTTEGQSEVLCPEPYGEDVAVLLPNDENCSTFFTCTHGKPVLTDCPAGLEYNAASGVCDWPENAGCQSSNVPDSSAKPSTTAAPSSTTAASTTSVPSSTSGGQPEDTCPAENGEDTVLLPNKQSCNTFFICDNGNPVLFDCPSGLEFNPILRVCDWPADAGCQSSDATESTSQTSTTVAPSSTTTAKTTSAPSSTPVDQDQDSCPAQNDGDTVLLPNNKNCSTFFICANGKPVLTECPAGLEFNAAAKVCDYPADAGCQSTGTPESTSQPSSTVTASSTTEASTTSAPSSTVTASSTTEASTTSAPSSTPVDQDEDSCPAQNDGDTVLLPNNKNCSTFFICANGKPVLTECPAGLEFNAAAKVCDYPADAGCQSTGTPESTSQPSSTVTSSSTTEASTTSAPSSTVTASSTTEASTTSAPSSTVTASSTTEASTTSAPSSTVTASSTTEASTTTVPSSTPGDQDEVSCPDALLGVIVFLGNKKNCSTFYVCIGKLPLLSECPIGLEFNDILQVCDWPSAAGCQSTGKPESTSQSSTTLTASSTTEASTTSAPSSTVAPSSTTEASTTSKPSSNKPPNSEEEDDSSESDENDD